MRATVATASTRTAADVHAAGRDRRRNCQRPSHAARPVSWISQEPAQRRIVMRHDACLGHVGATPDGLLRRNAAQVRGQREQRDHEEEFVAGVFQVVVAANQREQQHAQACHGADRRDVIEQEVQMRESGQVHESVPHSTYASNRPAVIAAAQTTSDVNARRRAVDVGLHGITLRTEDVPPDQHHGADPHRDEQELHQEEHRRAPADSVGGEQERPGDRVDRQANPHEAKEVAHRSQRHPAADAQQAQIEHRRRHRPAGPVPWCGASGSRGRPTVSWLHGSRSTPMCLAATEAFADSQSHQSFRVGRIVRRSDRWSFSLFRRTTRTTRTNYPLPRPPVERNRRPTACRSSGPRARPERTAGGRRPPWRWTATSRGFPPRCRRTLRSPPCRRP